MEDSKSSKYPVKVLQSTFLISTSKGLPNKAIGYQKSLFDFGYEQAIPTKVISAALY